MRERRKPVAAVALLLAFFIGAAQGGAGVMMQGFYWDCPEDWYGTMAAKASELRYMHGGYGIDRIWFPAPQKSHAGRHSMGYDPFDYYDLGQYHQKGSTATRFGTQDELKSAIARYRSLGIACMADIVLNHRAGGGEEANPNLDGATTWTDFSGVASGRCTWRFDQFHPSSREQADAGPFEGFPDVCHSGTAGPDLIQWGRWLADPANAGFDGGWRLDYVKGVNPPYLKEFIQGAGAAYSVLECWGDIPFIEKYLAESACPAAFDFPAFYTMAQVFNHQGDIRQLVDPSKVLAAKHPAQAVTFVANHDTDKDAHVESIVDNTLLAYAFILTYQGYPCIFWKDYFNYGLAEAGGKPGNGIKPLVWVRGALGGGQPDIQLLKADDDNLLAYGTRSGGPLAPGYLVAINNHPHEVRHAKVFTRNRFLWNKTLACHAWYSYAEGRNRQPEAIRCNDMGCAILEVPPRGYVVYSVATELPEPWAHQDIGRTGAQGSAMQVDGVYTVTASGADIEGGEDAFHYASTQVEGDAALIARIGRLDHTHPWAKAGIMIRDGHHASAANAAVLATPANGLCFQWRTAEGDRTHSVVVGGVEAPCWVGLKRMGNTFLAHYSQDGRKWRQIGAGQTIGMAPRATAGLAVTSHENGTLATAIIDNLSLASP
ncbi:alpha-amylase family glycosyl hydrolase [Pontiella desulfatans]|uniref:alpha-amylase family glycosyl hydrolase n=1 Tax=Pontiella desulfatans TaxID=2750659 RepID=UPI001C9E4183|nr:alpha-amylase family glycosyl hydrolase [Pontiella desulfatans]